MSYRWKLSLFGIPMISVEKTMFNFQLEDAVDNRDPEPDWSELDREIPEGKGVLLGKLGEIVPPVRPRQKKEEK